MAKAKEAQEPSMEEILASIRRIISDEGGEEKSTSPLPAPPSEEELDRLFASGDEGDVAGADVLLLTEEIDDEAGAPPVTMEDSDLAFIEAPVRPQQPAPTRAAAAPLPPAQNALPRSEPGTSAPKGERIMSARTDASVQAAFGSLSHIVLAAKARTLDDLVEDMLRPMLQAWLDENLPPMVERLVRQEIDRVARNGR